MPPTHPSGTAQNLASTAAGGVALVRSGSRAVVAVLGGLLGMPAASGVAALVYVTVVDLERCGGMGCSDFQGLAVWVAAAALVGAASGCWVVWRAAAPEPVPQRVPVGFGQKVAITFAMTITAGAFWAGAVEPVGVPSEHHVEDCGTALIRADPSSASCQEARRRRATQAVVALLVAVTVGVGGWRLYAPTRYAAPVLPGQGWAP